MRVATMRSPSRDISKTNGSVQKCNAAVDPTPATIAVPPTATLPMSDTVAEDLKIRAIGGSINDVANVVSETSRMRLTAAFSGPS